ncbi:MAG TPA: 2OG-Fe(II) oxygenase [Gammaproteobacteria bacterium]|nr:2OG-Fe(II) oxygenase [Gammaproteobacteria bacterium]
MSTTACIEPAVYTGQTLEKNGYTLCTAQDIPFTPTEWARLEFLTDEENLSYSKAQVGDTNESLSMGFFRIKKPGELKILHEELMQIIASPKMLNFYREICQNNKLWIDRCQAHLYKTNDFIARHVDKESYQGYLYSLLFAISQDFLGGEMVLYNNKGTVDTFKLPYRSLLLADSAIPHEVLPVKSGVRKTLAFFLME